MDTCMGMGFIDTDESNAPTVTRIDPTTGPRTGGSAIVVAGAGRKRHSPFIFQEGLLLAQDF